MLERLLARAHEPQGLRLPRPLEQPAHRRARRKMEGLHDVLTAEQRRRRGGAGLRLGAGHQPTDHRPALARPDRQGRPSGERGRVGQGQEQQIGRVVAKTPVHIFLVAVGLLWLVPTLGLFFTSLLPAANFGSTGWWKILSKPSVATWQNYHEIFRNSSIKIGRAHV